jgi:hypothetical protein
LIGVLIYDVAAAVILAYAAVFMRLVGVALWPAVALHGTLALWCAACFRAKARDSDIEVSDEARN